MSVDALKNEIPPGLSLAFTLWQHEDKVNKIAWSPDGRFLASCALDRTVRIWDAETGGTVRVLRGHSDAALCVAWAINGRWLATGSKDSTVRIWDTETWRLKRTFRAHTDWVYDLAWSPTSKTLASASADSHIHLWNIETGEIRYTLDGPTMPLSLTWSSRGGMLAAGYFAGSIRIWDAGKGRLARVLDEHTESVYTVVWSPDGHTLASGSDDNTIRLWDATSGRQYGILEGHTDVVNALSFSADGSLLASKSSDDTVRLWRFDTWETVAVLHEPTSEFGTFGLAFHPERPAVATLGEEDTVVRIWDLDLDLLLDNDRASLTVHYTNAKIVLVGDTGVGKSGLGLVLTSQAFRPTESTHGRHVWMFESMEADIGNGRIETREALLWDLAGQPSYRLVHQLHLSEVTVALVVFDARSETDPLAGVYHWDRALRQAQRVQGRSALPMRKFLVAARSDRGGVGMSRPRVESLLADLNFDGYFETSAREGWGVEALREAIQRAIHWEAMPRVSSTELFQRIKAFLLTEKEANRILSTSDQLFRVFLLSGLAPAETEELCAQFETCIGLVESRGLIRRLSFGDLVLLQPELLDSYASAIVNAAKDEPDGLGSILEEDARMGRFRMSEDERIANREQERLLLIATVEDLLRYEIALREQSEAGPLLVFPSQFTRQYPALPHPEGRSVVFTFEGPVLNIYATLAVRLSHSGVFRRREMWKNAATYQARVGGMCGLFLREIEEGQGELTLFYDEGASEETRFQFEEYVSLHLERRALPETVQRRRIFACAECGTTFTDQQVNKRRERGYDWIECNVCEARVSLLDREERLIATTAPAILEMDRSADQHREMEAGLVSAVAVMQTQGFDAWVGASKSTLALVFTDVVGSTRLGNELGYEVMREILRAHFSTARTFLSRYNGYEIKTIGDAMMVAFRKATDALEFLLALREDTGHPQVRFRAGLHIGPVVVEAADAFGATVNFAARITDYTDADALLVSAEARARILATDSPHYAGLPWKEHSRCELKGFPGLHTLWEVEQSAI